MSSLRIAADVAFEYVDDGGVLACCLSNGTYWQLGPPAALLWRSILEGLPDRCWPAVAVSLGVATSEAPAALRAFADALAARGLVELDVT